MHEHPAIGERILRPLPGFDSVATAVRHAHESWDGHGYPDGLAGEAIPLASRIVLACDAWHALVSDRPYRAALAGRRGARGARALRRLAVRPAGGGGAARLPRRARRRRAAPRCPGHGAGTGDVLQHLSRELRVLMSLSSAVAATNSLPELLDLAAEESRTALDATSVSVSRWEAQAEVLRTVVNAGVLAPGEETPPERRDLPAHRRRPAQAAAARGPLLHRRPRRPRPAPDRADPARAARPALVPGRADHARRRRVGRAVGEPRSRAGPTSTSTTCGSSTRSPARSPPASAAPSCSAAWPSSRSRTASPASPTGARSRSASGSRSRTSRRSTRSRCCCATSTTSRSSTTSAATTAATGRSRRWRARCARRPRRCRARSWSGSAATSSASSPRASSVEAVRRVAELAIERLAGHRPPVGLSCGIASSRLELQPALRAPARRRRRALLGQAHRPRPRLPRRHRPADRVALDRPPRRPPRPPRRARGRHQRAARAGARAARRPAARRRAAGAPRGPGDLARLRRCARRPPRSRCARTAPA